MRSVIALAGLLLLSSCSDDSTTSTGGGGATASAGGGGADGAGGSGGDAMGGAGGTSGVGGQAEVPPCGPGMDVWIDPSSNPGNPGADIGTPENAWQVGTATQSQPYVQANVSDTGNAFFVFCAGPALDEISIFLNSVDGSEFSVIHLHEAESGAFGNEVPPTTSSAAGATWPLTPGDTYVLELANDPGSFF